MNKNKYSRKGVIDFLKNKNIEIFDEHFEEVK